MFDIREEIKKNIKSFSIIIKDKKDKDTTKVKLKMSFLNFSSDYIKHIDETLKYYKTYSIKTFHFDNNQNEISLDIYFQKVDEPYILGIFREYILELTLCNHTEKIVYSNIATKRKLQIKDDDAIFIIKTDILDTNQLSFMTLDIKELNLKLIERLTKKGYVLKNFTFNFNKRNFFLFVKYMYDKKEFDDYLFYDAKKILDEIIKSYLVLSTSDFYKLVDINNLTISSTTTIESFERKL